MTQNETKQVVVGGIPIGGGAPILIQSMTNTDTSDLEKTKDQIAQLEAAGCELIRVSIPDDKALRAFEELKKVVSTPLIADIHFRSDLALGAIEAGADKLRINPGNIGDVGEVRSIAEAAKDSRIPIRIGVNSGSLNKKLRDADLSLSKKLVESALMSVEIMESVGFGDIVISAKAFGVLETIEVYRSLAGRTDYPLHLGITESGTLESGPVRSAVGIGILLAEGIGDTLRVSLAADPVHEVHVAQQILQSLEIRKFRPELIACPTCSRCEVDLIPIAREVEKELSDISVPLKVAVMGCSVNGPGEARQADVGIAAGKGKGVLFKDGQPVKTIDENSFVVELLKLIKEDADVDM